MTIASVSMTEEPSAAPPATPRSAVDGLRGLFEEHHRLVFRTACRVTGNASDAEDVLQTIFLRLLHRPPESIETAKAAGYLRRAAINASLDLIRSRRRSRLVALDQQVLEELGPSPAVESDPARRFASLELRNRLRRELANVNPRAAGMFVLRYFEGYGNSEIGAMLGASRMTVAVTLHRLRRRLGAVLSREDATAAPTGGLAPNGRKGRKGREDQEETRRVLQ